MSNATNGPKANGGVGTLLTTLAGSGDKMIQLLIVGGIILNTVWTKNNSTGINNNTTELDKIRKQVATQVRAIHGNQTAWAHNYQLLDKENRLLLENFGIRPPDDRIAIPRPSRGLEEE